MNVPRDPHDLLDDVLSSGRRVDDTLPLLLATVRSRRRRRKALPAAGLAVALVLTLVWSGISPTEPRPTTLHEPTISSSLSLRSEAQVGEGGSAHAEPGEGAPPRFIVPMRVPNLDVLASRPVAMATGTLPTPTAEAGVQRSEPQASGEVALFNSRPLPAEQRVTNGSQESMLVRVRSRSFDNLRITDEELLGLAGGKAVGLARLSDGTRLLLVAHAQP